MIFVAWKTMTSKIVDRKKNEGGNGYNVARSCDIYTFEILDLEWVFDIFFCLVTHETSPTNPLRVM